MKCKDLDGIILWSLALLVIGDLLVLYVEKERQHCNKISEQEKNNEIKEMKNHIQNLEFEINTLRLSKI